MIYDWTLFGKYWNIRRRFDFIWSVRNRPERRHGIRAQWSWRHHASSVEQNTYPNNLPHLHRVISTDLLSHPIHKRSLSYSTVQFDAQQSYSTTFICYRLLFEWNTRMFRWMRRLQPMFIEHCWQYRAIARLTLRKSRAPSKCQVLYVHDSVSNVMIMIVCSHVFWIWFSCSKDDNIER